MTSTIVVGGAERKACGACAEGGSGRKRRTSGRIAEQSMDLEQEEHPLEKWMTLSYLRYQTVAR